FFFQAEDGIRDFHVTGVQTCALPISWVATKKSCRPQMAYTASSNQKRREPSGRCGRFAVAGGAPRVPWARVAGAMANTARGTAKIGRAACRERGGVSELAAPPHPHRT